MNPHGQARPDKAGTTSTDAARQHAVNHWPVRLARGTRRLHRWIGMALALVMSVLAVTGGFVAFKKQVEYLQPATRTGAPAALTELLTPADIAQRVLALGLPEAEHLGAINRIELRPAKRVYKVRLEAVDAWSSPRELQFDAGSGVLLNDGLRGDQLWMDLHSFAVFGMGAKLVIMAFAALALLWLSLSGLYLFFFPPWFRARKRRRMDDARRKRQRPLAGTGGLGHNER